MSVVRCLGEDEELREQSLTLTRGARVVIPESTAWCRREVWPHTQKSLPVLSSSLPIVRFLSCRSLETLPAELRAVSGTKSLSVQEWNMPWITLLPTISTTPARHVGPDILKSPLTEETAPHCAATGPKRFRMTSCYRRRLLAVRRQKSRRSPLQDSIH